ncbi:MAG: hypothetical protein PHW02_04865 [bacterium]|nr:hypothetical protein [bacterium]
MSKEAKVIFSLLSVILFISIHAEKPACIDYISGYLSEIKTMQGVYTKEITAGGEKVKTKITFYDDAESGKKHMLVSDSKGVKNDVYVLNDTLFIIDKPGKAIYFINIDEYGDVGKRLFDLNVFESLSILESLKDHDSIIVQKDKKEKLNVSFVSDTSNPVYSLIIVRFTKDSLPELIEMYDWNMKVMLQLQYSKFKDKLPMAIKAMSKNEAGVMEEKTTISSLKINSVIAPKHFEFGREGYSVTSLKDLLGPSLQ